VALVRFCTDAASIPRLERAIGAAAGLLPDRGRVEQFSFERLSTTDPASPPAAMPAMTSVAKKFGGPASGDGLLGAFEG
jgi:hypothetical protein